jgi:hypothetical protein
LNHGDPALKRWAIFVRGQSPLSLPRSRKE